MTFDKSRFWEAENTSESPLEVIQSVGKQQTLSDDLWKIDSLPDECQSNTIFWVSGPPSDVHDAPVGMSATPLDSTNACYAVCLYSLIGCAVTIMPAKSLRANILTRVFSGCNVSSYRAGKAVASSAAIVSQCSFRRAQPTLRRSFTEFRRQEVARLLCAKVGVLYQRVGQKAETSMYCNDGSDDSEAYTRFLGWLGERIQLKGYKGYRGGLDVRRDLTGPESIVAKFRVAAGGHLVHCAAAGALAPAGHVRPGDGPSSSAHELMFHVSTMMPTSRTDEQQVEKKRHIGNDNVVVVFQDDGDTPLAGSTFTSNMLMCVVRVWPEKDSERFFFRAMVKRGAAAAGPSELFSTEAVELDDATRDAFHTKLYQLNNAAWCTPELATQIDGMRRCSLEQLQTRK